MKQVFALMVMTMLSLFACFAQVNKYVYCEVSPVGKFLKGGCTLRVNYGQDRTYFEFTKKTRICDKDGRPVNFTNRVDALNWLSELGWEYCSSTTKVSGASGGGTSSRETWILKYCVNGLTKEQIDSVYLQFNVREQ